jgi:hypothetical protein
MMGLVAVLALLLAGVPLGLKLGLKVKEEVRARQAVVDSIQNFLTQSDSWVSSLETRLARSERQSVKDPRHDHWLEQIASWREIAADCRRDLPIYSRLARYPWLPFPGKHWERYYLSDQELAYLNTYQEPRAAAIWSGAGAAVVVAVILILTMIFVSYRLRS